MPKGEATQDKDGVSCFLCMERLKAASQTMKGD